MSGKGKLNGGGIIGAKAIVPFPIGPTQPSQPSQPTIIPNPYPTIPDSTQPTSFITAAPSTPATLTEVVTITKSDAQSTIPRRIATVTSIISVSNSQENNTSTVNIAAIILGIMVGLVIIGGSIVILIRRKFSKNKENENKKKQSQCISIISIDENVQNNENNVPKLPEIILDDRPMSQRESLMYFQPQFPVPPPRPQIPLPQHSPQHLQHSPQNPPIALYTGVNPNYYQKYSQLRPPTATNVTSSNIKQSQSSSTEIPG